MGAEIPESALDQELTSVAKLEQATGLIFDLVPASQKQVWRAEGGNKPARWRLCSGSGPAGASFKIST
jgi:hypothetical protein